jgi:hypothetical protein
MRATVLGGRAPKIALERVDLKVISANRRLENYSGKGRDSQPEFNAKNGIRRLFSCAYENWRHQMRMGMMM